MVKQTACQTEWVDATQIFFEYYESNNLFFSTMLVSKGAPTFRSKCLEFLIDAFKDEVDKGKNQGLSENVIVNFAANAYVGVNDRQNLRLFTSNGFFGHVRPLHALEIAHFYDD